MQQVVFWFFVSLVIMGASTASVSVAGEKNEDAVKQICANSLAGIERIQLNAKELFGGSGIFISSRRLLTNAHVVGDMPTNAELMQAVYFDESDIANAIYWVIFKEKKYRAYLIGRDPVVDLAILEVREDVAGAVPAFLGSVKDAEVGDAVRVCGNPGDFENTLTSGVVSAKRRMSFLYGWEYIQTDAAINPGNSGGPIILLRTGAVIGIVNIKFIYFEGTGFAIPIDAYHDIADDLRGTVRHAWLGIQFPYQVLHANGFSGLEPLYQITRIEQIATLIKIQNEIFNHEGVLTGGIIVSNVMLGELQRRYSSPNKQIKDIRYSPAKVAGIQRGDIIKRVGSVIIRNGADFLQALFVAVPYQETVIDLVRFNESGDREEIHVTIVPIIRNPEGIAYY